MTIHCIILSTLKATLDFAPVHPLSARTAKNDLPTVEPSHLDLESGCFFSRDEELLIWFMSPRFDTTFDNTCTTRRCAEPHDRAPSPDCPKRGGTTDVMLLGLYPVGVKPSARFRPETITCKSGEPGTAGDRRILRGGGGVPPNPRPVTFQRSLLSGLTETSTLPTLSFPASSKF